jgi:hypothetical protein
VRSAAHALPPTEEHNKGLPNSQVSEFNGDSNSLVPYKNNLTQNEVQYLLDKVAFGGNKSLLALGINQGLEALVQELVNGQKLTSSYQKDADFWTHRHFFYGEAPKGFKNRIWTVESIIVGQAYHFSFSPNPLHEWMLLQLSGHFATNLDELGLAYDKYSHIALKDHWSLLRKYAVGNFALLTNAFFLDPAMNRWLDNMQNHKGSPNQNYARELLELFILGLNDPITGASNYDEQTVVAATAAVSGYYPAEVKDPETQTPIYGIKYMQQKHDERPLRMFSAVPEARTKKTFKPKSFVWHVLFKHPGSSRYIAERFAGLMLYPGLSEPVVQELASLLKQNKYELKPFLKRILMSSAMFSTKARHACILSPIEHAVKLIRKLGLTTLPQEGSKLPAADFFFAMFRSTTLKAGQGLFQPPSVFGWKGSCNINRNGVITKGEGWLTNQAMLLRSSMCSEIMNAFNYLEFNWLQRFSISPQSVPAEVVEKVAQDLFGFTPKPDIKNMLAGFLTDVNTSPGESFGETVWANKKISRLICSLSDFPQAYRR